MAKRTKGIKDTKKQILFNKAVQSREDKIKDLLTSMPSVSFKEVRRYKMEYFDAIWNELNEEGYTEASKMLEFFVNFEERRKNAAGPNSVLWYKPMLKHQRTMLDCLKTGLQQAEIEKRSGHFGRACFVFLNLALYFQDKGENWYWIANFLYEHSCEIGDKYISDGRRRSSVAHYAYGKFLLEKKGEKRKAFVALEHARTISMGRLWYLPALIPIDPIKDISKFLGKEKEDMKRIIWTRELISKPGTVGTIYQETCILLQNLFHHMADNKRREGDVNQAIKLCQKSLQKAIESKRTDVQAEALKDLGINYKEKGDLKSAVIYFERLLKFSAQHEIWTAICEAHEQLGHAYTKLNEPSAALHHFNEFTKAAQSFQAKNILGRAFRWLGVYHLINENPDEAIKNLERAFVEYHTLKQKENRKIKEIFGQINEYKKKEFLSQDTPTDAKNYSFEIEKLKENVKTMYNPEVEKELEQTRVLGAIAKGLKHLPMYAEIVYKSSFDEECMSALMKWRGTGEPFWGISFAKKTKGNVLQDEYVLESPDTTLSSLDFPGFLSSDEYSGYSTSED